MHLQMKIMNEVPLLDTNTISSIINKRPTAKAKASICLLLQNKSKLCISDFTFVELIEGRRNLNEFNELKTFLSEYGILISGHSLDLSERGKNVLEKNFTSEDDFLKFKDKARKIKIDYMKDLYADMTIKYVVLLVTVLCYEDNHYFSPICSHIIAMFEGGLDSLRKISSEIIEKHFNNHLKSTNLLLDFALLLIEAIFEQNKPNYSKWEVHKKVEEMNIRIKLPSMTSRTIKKLKKKKEFSSLRKYNNELFLISLFRMNKRLISSENYILNDAMTYAVINSGFCQGQFQKNDLVDIYNIAYSVNEKSVYFRYFTEEKRWCKFAKLESQLEPCIIDHVI